MNKLSKKLINPPTVHPVALTQTEAILDTHSEAAHQDTVDPSDHPPLADNEAATFYFVSIMSAPQAQ